MAGWLRLPLCGALGNTFFRTKSMTIASWYLQRSRQFINIDEKITTKWSRLSPVNVSRTFDPTIDVQMYQRTLPKIATDSRRVKSVLKKFHRHINCQINHSELAVRGRSQHSQCHLHSVHQTSDLSFSTEIFLHLIEFNAQTAKFLFQIRSRKRSRRNKRQSFQVNCVKEIDEKSFPWKLAR